MIDPDAFANTPEPPYYMVAFSARHRDGDDGEYQRTAQRMVELAAVEPGFLGIESAHETNGLGITVSYWDSLNAIQAWKENLEHRDAQQKGREIWYERYQIRIARVERAYGSHDTL